MKVTITALGTRGDVQPFVALGRELQRRGSQVTLCANRDQAPLAQQSGLDWSPLDVDVSEFYRRAEVRDLLARSDRRGLIRCGQRWLSEVAPRLMVGLRGALRGADLVLSGFLIDDFALACAQAERARFVLSGFAPFLPSARQASIVLAPRDSSWRALCWASHRVVERLAFSPKRELLNAWRRELGVPAVTASVLEQTAREGAPYLGAWSPTLQPALDSYRGAQLVTGAWRLEASDRVALYASAPFERLRGWLDAGPDPVYLSFGSMPMLEPDAVLEHCRALARAHDARFLIASSDLPEDGAFDGVYLLREPVDHDALFPRCAAVIHHGGAGTTHSALHAGRPSWAISMFADAPYWGARLESRGLGGHTAYRALDRASLSEALRRLLSPELRARALVLAALANREHGVAVAADCLEQLSGSVEAAA